MVLRARHLSREPLCRSCLAKGFVREAVIVDHTIPLAFGGSDTDDNKQSLCAECNSLKTIADSASHGGGSTHPHWLQPSAVPFTVVCGPPCSGKTTYVRDHAKPGDVVIDIDAIALSIRPGYVHWHGMMDGELLNKSLRMRNAILGALARREEGAAWLIVGAPTEHEREWWNSKLGGRVVLLDPGSDECKRRAVERGTPAAVDGVDRWYKFATLPWRAPAIAGCDAQGQPADPHHHWNKQ